LAGYFRASGNPEYSSHGLYFYSYRNGFKEASIAWLLRIDYQKKSGPAIRMKGDLIFP
jgi:hypothetical protein